MRSPPRTARGRSEERSGGSDGEGRRARRRKRKRRGGESSSSSDSDRVRLDEDGNIREAAKKSPGALLQSGLEAMQKFLSQGELGDRDRQVTTKLRSIVTQCLTTALPPFP